MAEFSFRNLSVKLFGQPVGAEGVEMCVDRTTNIECGPRHTCFELTSTPVEPACGWCTFCTFQTCNDPLTNFAVVRGSPGEWRAELAAHKQRLLQVIERIEQQERALEAEAKPSTVAEADELRARLEEALAELDEHRSRLASGGEGEPG